MEYQHDIEVIPPKSLNGNTPYGELQWEHTLDSVLRSLKCKINAFSTLSNKKKKEKTYKEKNE
jgi:hypothetical protein